MKLKKVYIHRLPQIITGVVKAHLILAFHLLGEYIICACIIYICVFICEISGYNLRF